MESRFLAANFGDFDAGADAILSRRATPICSSVSSGDLVVSNSRRKKEKEIKNRFKMIYLARGDYDERKKLVANVDNSRGQIS